VLGLLGGISLLVASAYEHHDHVDSRAHARDQDVKTSAPRPRDQIDLLLETAVIGGIVGSLTAWG
jgi:hypothetical protein